jgi:hypothetical protein
MILILTKGDIYTCIQETLGLNLSQATTYPETFMVLLKLYTLMTYSKFMIILPSLLLLLQKLIHMKPTQH